MGKCIHRFYRGSAKIGSMGLDPGGPTHKQKEKNANLLHQDHPYSLNGQDSLGSFSIISSLHGMLHSIVSTRGPDLH